MLIGKSLSCGNLFYVVKTSQLGFTTTSCRMCVNDCKMSLNITQKGWNLCRLSFPSYVRKSSSLSRIFFRNFLKWKITGSLVTLLRYVVLLLIRALCVMSFEIMPPIWKLGVYIVFQRKFLSFFSSALSFLVRGVKTIANISPCFVQPRILGI